MKEWTLAADEGNSRAQYLLGLMYFHGKRGTPDYEAAFKWLKLAADQGFATAQYNIGNMYEQGLGVPRNIEAAF